MTDELGAPILIKAIPLQIVCIGAALGPLNLNDFIQSPNELSGKVKFSAEQKDGKPVPPGLMCTTDGIFSGIPGKGTEGGYEITVIATNESGAKPLTIEFALHIKSHLAIEERGAFDGYKTKVWEALMNNLPLPEMGELLNRPVSAAELYYLLERFGVLTIWDVYNLEMPSGKKILQLEGMSKHYNIYDRGSCLVGAPKELFSHERTPEDALQTAKAMAREVYQRGWTIELAGFNKMIRGAWVELQHLGDKNGKHLDILHFNPSTEDLRVYVEEARAIAANTLEI